MLLNFETKWTVFKFCSFSLLFEWSVIPGYKDDFKLFQKLRDSNFFCDICLPNSSFLFALKSSTSNARVLYVYVILNLRNVDFFVIVFGAGSSL